MLKTPQNAFHVYRFQLLPLSQQELFQIGSEVLSLDSLKAKKNEMFARVLANIPSLDYEKTELVHKVENIGEGLFRFSLAVKRKLTVSPTPFDEHPVPDWPSLDIVINNDPLVQKIAIENDPKVFQHSTTAAGILERNFNLLLKQYDLAIFIEPTFEKNDFWALVSEHEGKITSVKFELISPNMANISKTLTIDLKSLNSTTNNHKTKIELSSDKDSSLTLSPESPLVDSLVNYASEGGGKISMKIRGYRKTITTERSIIERRIDLIDITSETQQELADAVKNLLN